MVTASSTIMTRVHWWSNL